MCKIALLLLVTLWSLVSPSAYACRDTAHVGEINAVNVPGLNNWQQMSMEEAKEVARDYRWIYANASLKDLYEAKEEQHA